MAVVTVKSGMITNRDATTVALSNAAIAGGMLKNAVGTCEAANGDSIASKYIMCQVPSNARISKVLLSCDAITSGAADIGIYQTTANGSAVVDVDYFGSAVSIATALNHSDVTHEADAADAGVGFGQADVEKFLWQGLQLSADSGLMYDIVLTLTAATTAAGTISLEVEYVI